MQDNKHENLLEDYRKPLLKFLECGFPRLKDEVEDLVQRVFAEALECGFDKKLDAVQLRRWLYTTVRRRAIDYLRKWERRAFIQLAQKQSHSDLSGAVEEEGGAGPQTQALEEERRQRQGVLLSQVLQEFVRWCESSPRRILLKEAYERALRGQSASQIAQAMQVSSQQVYQWCSDARCWIYDRIIQKDIDRTVFLTWHRARNA